MNPAVPPVPRAALAMPTLSFEFFPPRTIALEQQLWACMRRLEPLAPSFVSVTYGTGGTTQERTHATVARLLRETSLTPAAHLTGTGASRDEVDAVAHRYWADGVRHVVALRGDAPSGGTGYQPHPEGYAYAADLVAGLRRVGDFEISVAAYPETHPDAHSPQHDLDNLKRKIDAGASRAITQYFFDTGVYLRCLVTGILPVANFRQVAKFSALCGASVPGWMGKLFEGLESDPETSHMVAAAMEAEQVRLLRANGVDEFHFYTLNRADLQLCHRAYSGRAAKGIVKAGPKSARSLALFARRSISAGVLASLIPLLAFSWLLLGPMPAVAGCSDAAAPGVDWRRCLQDGRDLQGASLAGAVLRDASFSRAKLQGAQMAGAEAQDVRFTSADLSGADLTGAVLRGADFTRVVMRGGSLARADLRGARFFRADLRGVDFQGAELAGADLSGAQLEGALWVDGQRRCGPLSVGACE